MDDRFFHGLIGSPTRVCHYDLKALTPWHFLLLSAIHSPVLDPDKECGVNDLLVCLKVLQLDWPQVPDLKSTTRDKWWAFQMNSHRVARREFSKFSQWIEVQLSFPEFWDKDDDSDSSSEDTSNMPGVLSLVAGMVCNSSIQLRDAWNMRISEARWYQAAIAHNNGADFKLVDQSQEMPTFDDVKPSDAVDVARQAMPPKAFAKWHEAYKKNQMNKEKN